MRNISPAFRRKLFNNQRDYLAYATITLADDPNNPTQLNLTNSEIWVGGFSCEQAVSDDNEFTALGSVIIGSATLIINNVEEAYSQYDFNNATVLMKLGTMIGSTPEIINIGIYRVDDATYNGATITLRLLDYLEQFDRPYKTTLNYPTTLLAILQECCTKCGVQLGTQTFPHYNFRVPSPKIKDGVTYRDVISWVATIAGCFVKVSTNATAVSGLGKLELSWFDVDALDSSGLDGGKFDSATPYQSGDSADGGTFNPWNTGDVADGGSFLDNRDYHYLYGLKSQTIATDDTVITGVSIAIENTTNQSSSNTTSGSSVIIDVGDNETTYTMGSEGYIIQIKDNGFITDSNVTEILTWLHTLLYGLTFRKVSVSKLDDPSVEAGDVAKVVDRKGNEYNILVTRATFSIGNYQQIVCGAATPLKNSSTQYSEATRNYVKSKKLLFDEKSARQQAIDELSQALASKSGLFTTIVTGQDQSKVYYLHDKADLDDSSIVWKMTAEAWAVTAQYNAEHPDQTVWSAGVTFNGTVLAQTLSAIGIDADWITSGMISSRDGRNTWDLDSGQIITRNLTPNDEDVDENDVIKTLLINNGYIRATIRHPASGAATRISGLLDMNATYADGMGHVALRAEKELHLQVGGGMGQNPAQAATDEVSLTHGKLSYLGNHSGDNQFTAVIETELLRATDTLQTPVIKGQAGVTGSKPNCPNGLNVQNSNNNATLTADKVSATDIYATDISVSNGTDGYYVYLLTEQPVDAGWVKCRISNGILKNTI